MKKILLSGLLLLSVQQSYNHVQAYSENPTTAHSYTPAKGILQLEDSVHCLGTITQALSVPELHRQSLVIKDFAATTPNCLTYQDIIFAIHNKIADEKSIAALKAFEEIIMYLYHKEAYAVSLEYNQLRSLFFNGVRYSWIDPIEWIKIQSWSSDNNKKLDQLIEELNRLATIAMNHDKKLGLRMKLTVMSYRNWRNGIVVAAATYVAINAYYKKSNSLASEMASSTASSIQKHLREDASAALKYTSNKAHSIATASSNKLCSMGESVAQKTVDISQQAYSCVADKTNAVCLAAANRASDIIEKAKNLVV